MNEMLDLAVLNERLAGRLEPWEARSRLEYLKMRKKNWSLAYDYISKQEVTATLSVIEDAYRRVSFYQLLLPVYCLYMVCTCTHSSYKVGPTATSCCAGRGDIERQQHRAHKHRGHDRQALPVERRGG